MLHSDFHESTGPFELSAYALAVESAQRAVIRCETQSPVHRNRTESDLVHHIGRYDRALQRRLNRFGEPQYMDLVMFMYRTKLAWANRLVRQSSPFRPQLNRLLAQRFDSREALESFPLDHSPF